MRDLNEPFPWGEFITIMAQVMGVLLGLALGVLTVFLGSIWLAKFVTKQGLRRGRHGAIVARNILMVTVALTPAISCYAAMIDTGAPTSVAICMAVVGLVGGGSVAAVVGATSDRVLRKHDEAQ